jgi:hypothetical protein
VGQDARSDPPRPARFGRETIRLTRTEAPDRDVPSLPRNRGERLPAVASTTPGAQATVQRDGRQGQATNARRRGARPACMAGIARRPSRIHRSSPERPEAQDLFVRPRHQPRRSWPLRRARYPVRVLRRRVGSAYHAARPAGPRVVEPGNGKGMPPPSPTAPWGPRSRPVPRGSTGRLHGSGETEGDLSSRWI